jgi:DNA-binding Lrp family transcriptional regulator
MTRNSRNKKSANVSVSSEASTGDKLDEILERLSSLDSIEAKLERMEKVLEAVKEENRSLKETVINQDKKIVELKDRLNNLEQHGRSFSIRVNNLALDGVDEREPTAVIKKVYDQVFMPILQGAVSKAAISQAPSCYEMIEMAHPLPGRGDKPKAIIVRFFNRNIKSLLFRHRKEFAVKTGDGPRARYAFPFHDDLTKDSFVKMKQMQDNPRVQSCWSAGGSLRYKLVESDVIRRVPSVYMTNDEILKSV